MKYHFLLINPWIYDFAAYNFWARPLGLLRVAEYLSKFDVKLSFIDCCDSFRAKKFGTGKYTAEVVEKPETLKNIPKKYKRYGIPEHMFIEKLKSVGKLDVIMITSIMAYWWYGVMRTIQIIRDLKIETPIILGGIYATLYNEHAAEKTGADYIFSGELNDRLIRDLENYGICLKRVREREIHWWRLGFYEKMPYAPVLTSVGCPFKCAYCASSLLCSNFRQRKKDEIIEEIRDLVSLGVKDFAFYDDALLYRAEEHIKPLLRDLIKEKFNINFHTPNGLHARFFDEELAKLMKSAGFKTIRLSLETVNIKRQRESGGKVTNEDLQRAVYYLKKAGFSSQEIGVYIMYGLPEQSLDEVRSGVDFLKKLKVRIHLTEFSPIKGTFYWKLLLDKSIIKEDLDPLLTNNSVFSEIFCGYDRDELKRLKIDVNQYNLLL